jgi:archaellum component FlaC
MFEIDHSSLWTLIFCAFIALCFFLGILFGRKDRSRFISSLPDISTSLGILGTFLGISLGLMKFNENAISESIPILLGGMKTAFITSLAGMTVSILLKLVYKMSDDRNIVSSDDPIQSLQKIEDAIVSCFKSDEEYSLVSQVKLIRQELIDSRRETQKAFKDFAEYFSKMASESLVAELHSVVDKFNVMLNDLVADSFRELTDATKRLMEWQDNYKTIIEKNQVQLEETFKQLEYLRSYYSEIIDRIGKLDSQFESIDSSLSAISTSSTELDEHSKALSRQNDLLAESITQIVTMGEKASSVVPELALKVEALLNDVENFQKETNAFVVNTTKFLKENAEQMAMDVKKQNTILSENTNEFVKKTTEELNDAFVLSTAVEN